MRTSDCGSRRHSFRVEKSRLFPAGFHVLQVAMLCTRVICQSRVAESIENERWTGSRSGPDSPHRPGYRTKPFLSRVPPRHVAKRTQSQPHTETTKRTQFRATRKDPTDCDRARSVRIARRTRYRTNPIPVGAKPASAGEITKQSQCGAAPDQKNKPNRVIRR